MPDMPKRMLAGMHAYPMEPGERSGYWMERTSYPPKMTEYVRADVADAALTVCRAIVDMADNYTNIAVLRAAEAAIAKAEGKNDA